MSQRPIRGAWRNGLAFGLPIGQYNAPETIGSPGTARGAFELDIPILTPLGQDITTLEHLDFNTVQDYRHLAESIYWRLTTPRGDLFYDPNYGFDVRNYVQAAWSRDVQYELEAFATEECEKDERILNATLSAEQMTDQRIRLSVLLETAQGPFKFVLAVSALSVEALGLPSAEPIAKILKVVPPTIFNAAPVIVPPSPNADVTITISSVAAITSKLRIGVTYMQYTLNPDGDPDSIARGKTLLTNAAFYHNIHIMGFGTDNPWPNKLSPTPDNWGSLDARVQLARDCGGIPVITFFGWPTWMIDASVTNGTDWNRLESAPLDQFEAAAATLCAAVAVRYSDVVYFQFYNEFKGLWDPNLAWTSGGTSGVGNWNYVKFTRMYNLAWNAVKAVRPNAKIGGPYLVIEGVGVSKIGRTPSDWFEYDPITPRNRAVLEYWMANKIGADFITIDRSTQSTGTSDVYSQAEVMQMVDWFSTIVTQLRTVPGYASLPIWYSEDYAWSVLFSTQPSEEFQAALVAEMLSKELLVGVDVSLRWAPEREPGGTLQQNWFSSTRVSGGGQATKIYDVYKHFHQRFSPGTVMRQTTSSSPGVVSAIASDTHVLLTNKNSSQKTVAVGSNVAILAPYEVRLIAR